MSEGAIKIFLEGFDRKDHLIQRLGKGLNSLLLQASPWPFTIWQEMQQILSVSLCTLWKKMAQAPSHGVFFQNLPQPTRQLSPRFLSNPKLPHIKGDCVGSRQGAGYVLDLALKQESIFVWPIKENRHINKVVYSKMPNWCCELEFSLCRKRC